MDKITAEKKVAEKLLLNGFEPKSAAKDAFQHFANCIPGNDYTDDYVQKIADRITHNELAVYGKIRLDSERNTDKKVSLWW